ncbi:hypothetical protein PRIPAC_88881, partial [Pristionchus pacificus]
RVAMLMRVENSNDRMLGHELNESRKNRINVELFKGMIPKGTTATPQLKQCAENAKCCYYNKHSVKGKFYHCESKCPDFKGNVFISKSNSEGSRTWCVDADGECRYRD